jgi:hypothetical protein
MQACETFLVRSEANLTGDIVLVFESWSLTASRIVMNNFLDIGNNAEKCAPGRVYLWDGSSPLKS